LRTAQSGGIYVTQRTILKFIAPKGRHVAPMGVKFGVDEWIAGAAMRVWDHIN